MKQRYRKHKGYRRNPGRGGRPVYYMPISRNEIRERRLLYGLLGMLASMMGGVALWIATL